MTNREKVITELKAYINYLEPLCSIVKDAIELLKEQEPKRMWLCNGELCCPQCGALCKSYYHYCDECGQAVKWDET